MILESQETLLSQDIFKLSSNNTARKSWKIVLTLLKERAEIETQKRCLKCGCESDPLYRICRNCGGQVAREAPPKLPSDFCDYKANLYSSFEEFSSSLPDVKFKTGEPDFIDPNGYENIIQVLQAIGFQRGIKQYGNGK